MTISVSKIQNSPNRTTLKFVATAGADTATVTLKSAALTVTATGNVTFSKANKSITRTTGSWLTDGFVPGTTLTITGTTSNNGTYSVITATATVLVVGVESLVDEVVAATVTAYNSDVSFPGQPFTTPLVNIASAQHSLGGSCLVARNTTNVLNLFGTWMDKNAAYGLAEQNDQNIVVTFGTAGGTLILELSKVGGFLPEAQRSDVWRA